MNEQVKKYFVVAAEARKAQMMELRELILEAMPDAEEGFEWGMVSYRLDGTPLAGLANRKKGLMFYVMSSRVIDQYQEQLGRLRDGKSCIRFKETRDLDLNELKALARKMLADIVREKQG